MGRRITCPTCGARSEIGARYCMRCGSSLQHVEGFLDYAGFERRFLASFIDDLIFLVPLFCVWIFSGVSLVPVLVIAIARWGYFAGMESSKRQATLGKMVMGIMVTDTEGERISLTTATVRYFAKIFLEFYLLIAFSEKKQGLHDMVADCLVVTKEYHPEEYVIYHTPSWHDAYRDSHRRQ